MSFVDSKEVMSLITKMIKQVFKESLSVDLGEFIEITYHEAIEKYGIDKPDLRNPLELIEVKELFKECDFKVFNEPANDKDSRIAAIKVPNGRLLTRKQIDDYTEFVGNYGAKGLAYIRVEDPSKGKEGQVANYKIYRGFHHRVFSINFRSSGRRYYFLWSRKKKYR